MLNLSKNRRLRLIYYTLTSPRPGVQYPNWLLNTCGPTSGMVSRQLIEREERDGEFRVIYFKGRREPLYFRATIQPHFLTMVIAEGQPWHWHYYEIPETAVRPDDVVFDCGAAEGLFAYNVAPRCGQVVCFEPLPSFIESMARTFAPFDNVKLVPKGLSDTSRSAFMQGEGAGTSVTDTDTGEKIELTTIDEFVAETGLRPTYIKADLEGHEERMLQGAARVIRDYKPRLALTTYHFSGDAPRMLRLVKELNPGYQILQKGAEHFRGDPFMLHAW